MNSKIAINVSPSSHTSQQHWRNSLVQVRRRRSSQQEKSHFYIMKRFLSFCNYAKCPFVRWIHSSQQWMNENEQREILQANGEYEEERRKVIEIHERWKILPKIPWEECYEKNLKNEIEKMWKKKKVLQPVDRTSLGLSVIQFLVYTKILQLSTGTFNSTHSPALCYIQPLFR